MNNFLIDSYASLLEYRLSGDSTKSPTELLYKSDTLVNPTLTALTCKNIIINLPIAVPVEDLNEMNTITARFSIGYGNNYIPYNIPTNREDVKGEDYDLLILTKHSAGNHKLIKDIDKSKYLLATDTLVDGELTATGYKLLSTKIENIE